MITTIDGVKCKRGEPVWEIGVTVKGVYMPTRSVVHSLNNPVLHPEKCWKSYDLCKKECEKNNKKLKL